MILFGCIMFNSFQKSCEHIDNSSIIAFFLLLSPFLIPYELPAFGASNAVSIEEKNETMSESSYNYSHKYGNLYYPLRFGPSDYIIPLHFNSLYDTGTIGKGITFEFFEAFSIKLSKYKNWINSYDNHDLNEVEQFVIYNGQIVSFDSIQVEIAMKTAGRTVGELFFKTKMGKNIKRFEDQVSKYFIVEYSKNISDDNAVMYLPGQMNTFQKKQKKDYKFSFRSSFHPNPETFQLEYCPELIFDYHNIKTKSAYNFSKDELLLIFENRLLNEYVGADVGVSLVHDCYQQLSGVFLISLEF